MNKLHQKQKRSRVCTFVITVSFAVSCLFGLGVLSPSEHIRQFGTYNIVESEFIDTPLALVRYPLTTCFFEHMAVLDTIDNHSTFRQRLQCYCLESVRPSSNRNCILRIRNVVIRHQYGGVKTKAKTVIQSSHVQTDIYMENTPVEFFLRIDSTRYPWSLFKVFLRGLKSCTTSELEDSLRNATSGRQCQWQLPYHKSAPYTVPFDYRDYPTLYIPLLSLQHNFFHSQIGPTGVLQISSIRDAINKFYFEQNKKVPAGERPTPLVSSANPKYRFNLSHPRITFCKRASCSRMNFTSTQLDRFTFPLTDRQEDILRAPLPPTFLRREILYGDDVDKPTPHAAEDPVAWFGRRLGYCQQELPHDSYALVDDLWLNVPSGQMGSQWGAARNYVEEPQLPKKTVIAEEYHSICPLTAGELTSLKWSSEKMRMLLDTYKPLLALGDKPLSQSMAPTDGIATPPQSYLQRKCTVLYRVHNGTVQKLCVLVVGRSVSYNKKNGVIRGMPFGFEHTVLNVLLTPSANFEWESKIRMGDMEPKAWKWNGTDEALACNFYFLDNLPKIPKRITFDNFLEEFNYQSGGLPPCGAFLGNPPFNFAGLSFSVQSTLFNSSQISRTSFDDTSLTEQYAQVQEANLFIFEEGAPLTWALQAKHGSTFIVLYSTNYMRFMRWRDWPRKQVGRKKKHARNFQPNTEFFTFFPEISGNVRLIYFVYQQGRLPSFARLREAYDRPWKPESILLLCECEYTRMAPWQDVHRNCTQEHFSTQYNV